MKLYDGGRAPNPRRVRVFLAEKGISVPLEQVDLGALAQKSESFSAINPIQRVPVLVLDDGTVISESIAICRYFEELNPEPALFGQGALEKAQVEMWNRRLELHLLFPISHVFRNSHPAMAKMEIPQVPAWAEANRPRIADFLGVLDRVLASQKFAAGDRFSVADITGMIAVDFMKPAKLAVPDDCANVRRWHAEVRGAAERGRLTMRLTIVGSGDAFGSGGRFNTCFWLETAKSVLLVDCGASTPVALKARGLDHGKVDGIVLSHLHGDHFGALPFLLLDAQLVARRERPLTVAGPPGSQARIEAALEIFFPRALTNKWRFPFRIVEIEVGKPTIILGHEVTTTEVIHQSGAPSTALRIFDGERVFAYSGDTEWTDALIPIADGADLFICECYGYAGALRGHLSWEILQPKLPSLRARRIMLTHMNPTMLAKMEEARAAGLLLAEDGMVVEI